MIAFFINDNPKSASYKCKEKKLLEKTWWSFEDVKVYTERNPSTLIEIFQDTKPICIFTTSIREFEDYSPTEICQFVLQVSNLDIPIGFTADTLYFDSLTAKEKIYQSIFEKYKELHPIIKKSEPY